LQFLFPSIAIAAGLFAAGVGIGPVAAQDAEGGIAAQSEASDGVADGQDAEPGSGENEDGPIPVSPPPENLPPPERLQDIIPQSAVENPENWATGNPDADLPDVDTDLPGPSPDVPIVVDADQLAPDPLSPRAPIDVEAALDQRDVPTPDPLEPEADVPALADIEAPDLVDLPELEEFRINDELILAFPSENDRFPEETDFIERFRALSAIEALDTDDDTVPQLAARARSDERLLIEMLRVYGYYDAQVVRQLSGGRRGISENEGEDEERVAAEDPQVRFDILPGIRYSYGAIDLGELQTLPEPDGSNLREVFGIRPGDPLYLDRIVEEENELRLALSESGYPFSEVEEPRLLIDHARQEGDLTLPVDTGGKYAFGNVTSSDPNFLSGEHLEEIARFEQGQTYEASLQSDLRRAILATGLVSSAVITPRAVESPGNGEPGVVALDVEMERAPLRTISGAIGYGTEDGFKLEAGWEHRNLFPPEGALRLRGIVGTREQLASVTFRRNNFKDRDQVLTIDAYASDIETEAVDARTVALRTSFERVSNLLFQKPLSWLVGAQVLYTDERNRRVEGIDRPRQTYLIGGLFGSATIDASDDLLDPTQGFRLTGRAEPEYSRSEGTDTYYVRAQVDASYYKSVGSTVLAARTRLATILGAQAFEVAPSRRLYSGGGGSVRGYGFQGIGPRNEFGEALGGGSVVEVGLEARIQTGFLDGAVEVVPFIDAGSVARESRPDFEVIQYGAGIGVRYKTSFGPIRADIGVPLNPRPDDAPVVVYVSLGQAF